MGRVFRSLNDVIYLKQKNFELGSGSFSSVRLVKHREDDNNKKYAMKELKRNSAQDIRLIMKEISLHRKLNHPHIIRFEDFIEENNKVYIFLEYAKNGDLFKFVKNNSLSQEQLLKLFYQTCLGMQYLHSNNIMHRDLKPENILLDDKSNVKICDFGWSAEFREQEERQTICGTYEYMAPEIFFKKKQTKKTDMWALGILLYELLHGHAPFQGQRMDQVLLQIQKKKISFKKCISNELKDLIILLLSFSPDKRPMIEDVLDNKIFKIFKNQKSNKEKNRRKKFNPLLFSLTGKENTKKAWKKKIVHQNLIEEQKINYTKDNLSKLKTYLQSQHNNYKQEQNTQLSEIKKTDINSNTYEKNTPFIQKNIVQKSPQKIYSYIQSQIPRNLVTNQINNNLQLLVSTNQQHQISQYSDNLQKNILLKNMLEQNSKQQITVRNDENSPQIRQQIIPIQNNIYSKFNNKSKNTKSKQKLRSFCSSSNLLLYDYNDARSKKKLNSSFSSNKFVNYDFKQCRQNILKQQETPSKKTYLQQEKYLPIDSFQNLDFILIFIVFEYTNQLCGKGCLSCVQNECLICNNNKQYYLDDQTKTCELIYINHCQRQVNGHCVQCDQDFILLNQKNGSVTCSPVSKKIDNCEIYKSPVLCKKCQSGFYPYQGGISCVRYAQKIENCYEYQYIDENNVACQICNNGFLLTEDKKECIKYDEDPNCLIASNFYCQECKQGYLPINTLFNDLPQHQRDVSFFNDIFAVQVEPYRQASLIKCVNSQPNCLNYSIKQVMEPEDSSNPQLKIKYVKKEVIVCSQCKKNYFLQQIDEKKFICSPTDFISNCEIYKSQDSCKRCRKGYFLNNVGHCEQTKKFIPNCLYYESETKCLECSPDYVLLKNDNNQDNVAVESFFKVLKKISLKARDRNDFIYQNMRQELEDLYQTQIIKQMNLGLDLDVLFGVSKKSYQNQDDELQEDTQNNKRILELGIEQNNDIQHKNELLQERLLKLMSSQSFKNDQLKSLNSITKIDRNLLNYDAHIKVYFNYQEQNEKLKKLLEQDLDTSLQCFRYSIQDCAKYHNGKCIYCNKDFYLMNNSCRKVEDSIQNCQIYYSEKECAQCINGFILYDNKCFRMNPIYNCEKKVFSEKGKCILCKTGYYFDQEQDKCVENKEVQDRKCLIFSSLSNPVCYLCNQDHFMGSDSKCYSEEVPLTGTIIGHHQKLKDLI